MLVFVLQVLIRHSGAQASSEQMEKILSYLDIGKQEGAECLIGGDKNNVGEGFENGYYIKPTVFKGHNNASASSVANTRSTTLMHLPTN